jgi:hypothetical protein
MIKKNDISKWGEFNFLSIWENVEHGKRLKSIDRHLGEIPYFSASEYNNGQTDSISNPLFVWTKSIIYTTFGDEFYVDYDKFTASDEIYSLQHRKLNKYNALFICTIIKENKYKFNFGRKAFKNKFSVSLRFPSVLKCKDYENFG